MELRRKSNNFKLFVLDRLYFVRSRSERESSENTKTIKHFKFKFTWQALCDQLLDSAIMGGIAGVSAYAAASSEVAMQSAVIAFLLSFLVKMKEYRQIEA